MVKLDLKDLSWKEQPCEFWFSTWTSPLRSGSEFWKPCLEDSLICPFSIPSLQLTSNQRIWLVHIHPRYHPQPIGTHLLVHLKDALHGINESVHLVSLDLHAQFKIQNQEHRKTSTHPVQPIRLALFIPRHPTLINAPSPKVKFASTSSNGSYLSFPPDSFIISFHAS